VVELKSISALLGACTSCPVLHGKFVEMHAYTVSLQAKLKEPIPTSCLLTVNSCIKVRLELQANKSPVVYKGPFFPQVVNPRYQIRGRNV
jgi:hypothetical protein